MKRILSIFIGIIGTSLLAATAFADPIHDYAKRGDIVAVQLELDKGVDVNTKDDRGRTPLHSQWILGFPGDFYYHETTVKLLIDNGADVNAKDEEGWTPLHWVAMQDVKKISGTQLKHIAQLLIANGAVLSARNKDGKTPLEVAKGATATYLQGVYATAATDNSQNNQTGNQPTANRPTGRRPTANRPTGRKPTANRSTGRKPTANRPTGRKPTANRSTGRKPTANRSARTQSPILKVLDANKDGLLSSLELQKLISRQTGRPTPLYNTLDTNRDGKLSSLELFGKP